MSLDKSIQNLSINDNNANMAQPAPAAVPPPLPDTLPPPPAASAPPVIPSSATNEIDEKLIQQQLLSAAGLNNQDLMNTIVDQFVSNSDQLANIINTTKKFPLDDSPLHICAKYGSYEVLDIILDQPGVEVDPVNNEGETPLFTAIHVCALEPENTYAIDIVECLIDAGANASSITNKKGQKPIDIVPKFNKELISLIESATTEEDAEGEDGEAPEFEAPPEATIQDPEGSEGESGSESE